MTHTGGKPRSAGRKSVTPQLCGLALAIYIGAHAGAFARPQSQDSHPVRGVEATTADITDQARSQFEAGRYVDVVNTLKASAAGASNPAALVWLGRAHLELRDNAAAIVDLERAVAVGPNDSEA